MVCEECRGTAGVQEDNGVVAAEFTLLDVVDKARHRFGGVDGIKEDTFGFRDQFEGINTFRCEIAVSLSNIVICILNICFCNAGVHA